MLETFYFRVETRAGDSRSQTRWTLTVRETSHGRSQPRLIIGSFTAPLVTRPCSNSKIESSCRAYQCSSTIHHVVPQQLGKRFGVFRAAPEFAGQFYQG